MGSGTVAVPYLGSVSIETSRRSPRPGPQSSKRRTVPRSVSQQPQVTTHTPQSAVCVRTVPTLSFTENTHSPVMSISSPFYSTVPNFPTPLTPSRVLAHATAHTFSTVWFTSLSVEKIALFLLKSSSSVPTLILFFCFLFLPVTAAVVRRQRKYCTL
ncbi:unnamed protein product [Linum tenue]|uniref:Uncharacterized protein n=1 Tax=Linum tenue TaxID=586396 RepID=A0AAV0NS64_9ROSI|nr:unnamed protein product [Linum tenue]